MPDDVISCASCGQQWPRDPALEVPCPACQAPVGKRCKRPSGHDLMSAGRIHASRDQLALKTVPGYRLCPKGPTARAAATKG